MQTLYLGFVGMGKSYLARRHLETYPRRIVIDPRAEHAGDIVTSDLDDFLALFQTGRDLAGLTLCHRPGFIDADEADELFELLYSCRGFAIFVDEVDQFCDPQRILPWLRMGINYRRHAGLAWLFAARRPASVHGDLCALSDEVYLFHIHHANDLKYVRDNCGPENAEKLPKLKAREFVRVQQPDPRLAKKKRKTRIDKGRPRPHTRKRQS